MPKVSYSGYRFPPEIIQQAIWLYLRFTLSFRDVKDLLAERGIAVSYETVRRWVNQGPMIAAHLRNRIRPSILTDAKYDHVAGDPDPGKTASIVEAYPRSHPDVDAVVAT